jgi:hypothetical protein
VVVEVFHWSLSSPAMYFLDKCEPMLAKSICATSVATAW